MKLFSTIKRIGTKGALVVATLAAVAGLGVAHLATAQADVTFPASTADCDDNAVVRCGVTSTTGLKRSYAADVSVRNIFAGFGVSAADISSIDLSVVAGYVTKTNEVYVSSGNTLVATNAVTAGRQNISPSTSVTTNGTTYYTRSPSVSFKSDTIPAFVVMKNGVFQYAVISSCANPVTATPKKPDYTIVKSVQAPGQQFTDTATVGTNTRVVYAINVTSTGEVAATNVVVKDVLPANVTYIDNTLSRDGVRLSNDDAFFNGGITIDSLPRGTVAHYRFAAIVGANETATTCTPARLTNTATISSPALPTKSDTAVVTKTCPPKPAYSCTSLTATRVGETNQFNFVAKASATNGATILSYSYDFNDGPVLVTSDANVSHTYSKPGTYNTSVTANVLVDGKTLPSVPVTGDACKQTITIADKQTPTYSCDKLTATQVNRTQYNFEAVATATNGASISNYTYNYGDNTTSTAAANTASHNYTAPGTYTVRVTANVNVNNTNVPVTSDACVAQITVAPQPYAECTGLNIVFGEGYELAATATYVANNGATLKAASFDFGDNTQVVTAATASANHTYTADGTYTITATLTFNGVEAGSTSVCQAVVSFETVQPTYTCDAFNITKGDNRTVTVAGFQTSADNGAVFKSVDLNWGDNQSSKNVTSVNGQTHTYVADGTYTITAIVHFTVNGQDVVASGAHCTQTVSFTTPQPPTPPTPQPPVAPKPPVVLVNTGAGSVTGLFVLVTLGSAIGYRWMLGRRLGDNA
ncbi:MAG: PKD domain-containing protein [Candidatus Saccharimonadales bacterium]